MSELLSAAAAALGTPEALVKRSAEARAMATGATVDEILAAWAGGAPAPAAETAAPEPEPATTEADAPAPPVQAPEIVVEVPAPAPSLPEPVLAGPRQPPVLVGVADNPLTVLAGVVGLFLIVLLVGLVGPSLPTANAGARTSAIGLTDAAEDGRDLYASLGCAACHTQMVRPVVADVGLGAVTLNDTNQVLGTRRFGPDLSNIGSRMTGAQIEAVVGGFGGHPAHTLSGDDLAALVAYLSESVTAEEDGR